MNFSLFPNFGVEEKIQKGFMELAAWCPLIFRKASNYIHRTIFNSRLSNKNTPRGLCWNFDRHCCACNFRSEGWARCELFCKEGSYSLST